MTGGSAQNEEDLNFILRKLEDEHRKSSPEINRQVI